MILTVVVIIVSLILAWIKWQYNHWKRLGVRGPEPTWVLGNIGENFRMKKQFGVIAAEWYKKYSDQPYIGFFNTFRPSLLIRDPDLVKNILIQDFQYFPENDIETSDDDLLANNPFVCNGEKWKKSRGSLAPLFTVNKIKTVLPLTQVVCKRMLDYVNTFDSDHDFNAKDISARFTTDNVAMTAYSLDAKSFTDENSEFRSMGKTIFQPTTLNAMKFIIFLFFPFLNKFFHMTLLSRECDIWFRRFIHNNRESRKSLKLQCEDLLQMLLITVDKHQLSDEDIVGHSLTFFIEGYETSSTLLTFALYELGRNPHIQKILQEEIKIILEKHKNEVSYECIQDMKYLDCVVNETLRMRPVALALRKLCVKPYPLPRLANQKEPYTIPAGTGITISILGLHMDPNLYPEPDEFRPERFSDEEKQNRHKAAFIPFGEGPRICPGLKFALTQIKLALVTLLQGFDVSISKNCKPLEICPKSFMYHPKYPILLNLKPKE